MERDAPMGHHQEDTREPARQQRLTEPMGRCTWMDWRTGRSQGEERAWGGLPKGLKQAMVLGESFKLLVRSVFQPHAQINHDEIEFPASCRGPGRLLRRPSRWMRWWLFYYQAT